jgi:hypothetical protein
MKLNSLSFGLVATLLFASVGLGQDAKFELPAIGGFAVSPDNTTLVVSLTAKTELVFYDTVAGKETKRITVEFQPTQMVWSDKVIFAAQKSSGQVHILDVATGKELAKGNASGPVRNLALVKDICFASNDSRQVFAIDAKGVSTKTDAQGSFIAADAKGGVVCTVIDGRARTDVMKYTVDGTKLVAGGTLAGKVGTSLVNVQAVRVSADGKQVGVVAGGGWAEADRKKHYSVPLYDVEDMKTQLGELETGAFPCGCAVHPVLPLIFACNGKEGSVFSAKSYAPGQKIASPLETPGAAAPSVLAFVAKGKKLAWGTTNGEKGVLKFYDLELKKEQQEELDKAFPGK